MDVTLTPGGEAWLRTVMARHPEASAADLIEQALAERVRREERPQGANPSPEAFDAWLRQFSRFSDKIPDMPEETFSREMIYQDHD